MQSELLLATDSPFVDMFSNMDTLCPADVDITSFNSVGSILHQTSLMLGEGTGLRNDDCSVPEPAYTDLESVLSPQRGGGLYDNSPISTKAASNNWSAASSPCASDVTDDVAVPDRLAPEDMQALEQFVQNHLQQNPDHGDNTADQLETVGDFAVQVKSEPHDEFAESLCFNQMVSTHTGDGQSKRKGGRPRDPVVFKPGVPASTVIKKERRKEQNRRAARRCREKKKAQIEYIVTDYDKYKDENTNLKEELADAKKKLALMKALWKQHATTCPSLKHPNH